MSVFAAAHEGHHEETDTHLETIPTVAESPGSEDAAARHKITNTPHTGTFPPSPNFSSLVEYYRALFSEICRLYG